MDSRRLLLNSVANVLGFVAQFAVSIVLAPVVVRALGPDRYGVWALAESVLAYLLLFDLGVGSALVRFIPRHLARDDFAGLNRTFSACLVFFTIAAFGAGACVAIGVLLCPVNWLGVPPEHVDEVRVVLLAAVANFAFVLPLSVFPAMLDGLNAFSAKTVIRTLFLVVRVPVTLWVIRGERPLLGLIVMLSVSNILESLVIAAAVVRRLPQLRFTPRSIDRETVRSIRGFSINSFIAMIAGRLTFSTDAFVIGAVLGAAAITPFTFANRLVDFARFMLRSATVTLAPAISASEAGGDVAAIRRYFLQGTRLVLFAALPIQAGLLILGKPFLAIWLYGTDVAEVGGPTLWVLAATLSLTIAQSAAARVMYGMGRIRLFARMALAEGFANLLLSLALVKPLGIVGVAWGTAIPHVGFCVYAIAHACRLSSARPGEYVRCWLAPLAASVVPITIWLVKTTHGSPTTLGEFVSVGILGIAPYAILVAMVECRHWLASAAVGGRRFVHRLLHGQNAAR
jgi:O-antigen/teichoic acid export membrane protein